MIDMKCANENCRRNATRGTKHGMFCLEHYVRWKNEVLASGGHDEDVAFKMLSKCNCCRKVCADSVYVDQHAICSQCIGEVFRDDNESPRKTDPIDHPPHYTGHPSGIECIAITEHMGFCLGNAIKYIWRAADKGGIEDLEKARWYITREIDKQKKD